MRYLGGHDIGPPVVHAIDLQPMHGELVGQLLRPEVRGDVLLQPVVWHPHGNRSSSNSKNRRSAPPLCPPAATRDIDQVGDDAKGRLPWIAVALDDGQIA